MRYLLAVFVMALVGCGKVEAQCQESSDCLDPSAPFCVNNKCIATCGTNADCTEDPAKQVCASDGACVGCESSSTCSATTPVCDTGTRACRACSKDSECGGGVCVE